MPPSSTGGSTIPENPVPSASTPASASPTGGGNPQQQLMQQMIQLLAGGSSQVRNAQQVLARAGRSPAGPHPTPPHTGSVVPNSLLWLWCSRPGLVLGSGWLFGVLDPLRGLSSVCWDPSPCTAATVSTDPALTLVWLLCHNPEGCGDCPHMSLKLSLGFLHSHGCWHCPCWMLSML